MVLSDGILKECENWLKIRSEQIRYWKSNPNMDDKNLEFIIKVGESNKILKGLCGDLKLANLYCELLLHLKKEEYELAELVKDKILNYN